MYNVNQITIASKEAAYLSEPVNITFLPKSLILNQLCFWYYGNAELSEYGFSLEVEKIFFTITYVCFVNYYLLRTRHKPISVCMHCFFSTKTFVRCSVPY